MLENGSWAFRPIKPPGRAFRPDYPVWLPEPHGPVRAIRLSLLSWLLEERGAACTRRCLSDVPKGRDRTPAFAGVQARARERFLGSSPESRLGASLARDRLREGTSRCLDDVGPACPGRAITYLATRGSPGCTPDKPLPTEPSWSKSECVVQAKGGQNSSGRIAQSLALADRGAERNRAAP